MKAFSLLPAIFLSMAVLSSIPAETKAQRVNVNFSVFYNELGRHGRWVDMPRYGQVWIYNEPGFRPYYSNGYWDYSDYGWAWVSDYEWGWAPFHYGRWEQDPRYGWFWVPGYDWAPAWVSWSESGDYYGWAPLGFGVDINISIGSVPYDRWVFCSRPYMNNRGFRNYCAPFSNNRVIVRNTTIINNYYGNGNARYWRGPGRRDVERYSGNSIHTRRIDNDMRYGNRRWDDDRRDYATRGRDNTPNRFEGRDNNSRREFPRNVEPDRRNRNSDENVGRGRNDNRRPESNDIRRGRNERTREIREDNTRNTRPGNNNMRREMPNREQRQITRPDMRPNQQGDRGDRGRNNGNERPGRRGRD